MAGEWRGERLGACTDCRRYWNQFRAEELDAEEISDVQNNLCPTAGTCMVMGYQQSPGASRFVLELLFSPN